MAFTWRLERGERLSGSIDLAQDVFALGFPNVALGIFVARGQERDDRVGQFSGRGKALFGNEFGEVTEEALDQIATSIPVRLRQPNPVHWCLSNVLETTN